MDCFPINEGTHGFLTTRREVSCDSSGCLVKGPQSDAESFECVDILMRKLRILRWQYHYRSVGVVLVSKSLGKGTSPISHFHFESKKRINV